MVLKNYYFLNLFNSRPSIKINPIKINALPLLLFNIGVKRLRLATVGFLQYLGPSLMFILAVFAYGEPLSVHQLIAFIFIWAALVVYTMDSIRSLKCIN